MPKAKNKIKLEFAPGCFDDIGDDVTQEDIDQMVAYITQAIADGSIMEMSEPLSDEEAEKLFQDMENKRNTRQ